MSSVKYDKGRGFLSKGQYHKDRIFDFILKNTIKKLGVTKTTIRTQLTDSKGNSIKLSRPTIDLHLVELLKEDKIYRIGTKYFVQNSFLNDFLSFSRFMSDNAPRMMDRSVIDLNVQEEPYSSIPKSFIYKPKVDIPRLYDRPTPYDYFKKTVSGFSLSKKVRSKGFLDKNDQEKLLFEYVNRLGAYITYIFVQALFPAQQRILHKEEAVNSFIGSAIDLERMFSRFRMLITQAGLTHINSDELEEEFQEYEDMWELDVKRFERLSKLFRALYPSIYDGLENFWRHSNAFWRKNDEALSLNKSCRHDWKLYEFFKLGSHYRCPKCMLIISERFYNQNFMSR